MVKECMVKLNNDVVTVVAYGNIDVQLPAIHKEAKTIFVKCENGKYSVVEDYKPNSVAAEKKNTKKKTTIEEIVKETEPTDEDA